MTRSILPIRSIRLLVLPAVELPTIFGAMTIMLSNVGGWFVVGKLKDSRVADCTLFLSEHCFDTFQELLHAATAGFLVSTDALSQACARDLVEHGFAEWA
jgi:hypothetical protein